MPKMKKIITLPLSSYFFLIIVLIIIFPKLLSATFFDTEEATLRWLDKVTGRVSLINLNVGDIIQVGVLYIQVQKCMKRPVDEAPESVAFIKIWEVNLDLKQLDSEIFSGWMFASSPALSALDHPVYDIWVLECNSRASIQSF